VLQAAIAPAIEAIEAEAPALLSETSTGCSVNYHVTPVTHDPLKRAALTIYRPGTHVNKEALYFGAAAVDGVALTGANDYTLTFPAGQLPPVRAFWSLILYDATTFRLMLTRESRDRSVKENFLLPERYGVTPMRACSCPRRSVQRGYPPQVDTLLAVYVGDGDQQGAAGAAAGDRAGQARVDHGLRDGRDGSARGAGRHAHCHVRAEDFLQ
jgi:Protein of unknown function (DUF1214)